ncbi:MAG: hypothetical protein ACOYWZ_16500 [Bacillota bacterium]
MKEKKTSIELMKEIRGTWEINPATRVHDNDIRRNKKKDRQDAKNICKQAICGKEDY